MTENETMTKTTRMNFNEVVTAAKKTGCRIRRASWLNTDFVLTFCIVDGKYYTILDEPYEFVQADFDADNWEIAPDPPRRIEVVEGCPHCSKENILEWCAEKDGLHAFCAYCGETLMLCSVCSDAAGGAADCGNCPHKKVKAVKPRDDVAMKTAVITMTFQEIKEEMKKGCVVRRLAWIGIGPREGIYLCANGRIGRATDSELRSLTYALTLEDIDADDWVVVGEAK